MKEKKILDSRYQIEKKIGSGGSSQVYLCTHLKLDMQCAIKIIAKNRNSFIDGKKEAHLLRDLSHSKIPRIIDVLEDDENFYIVREFCDGLNLRESLDAKGPMPYDMILYVAQQIADVLDFFHKQNPPVIYRDLKPENIIIDDKNQIKLIDLGISRRYDINKDDDTRYIGSQKYAAPEQFGLHQSTIQTDVYAFGLLIYFLYTAEDFVDISEDRKWYKFAGKKADKLKLAITKAISLNVEDRYHDIASFMAAAFSLDKSNQITLPLIETNSRAVKFKAKINVAFMGMQTGIGTTHLALCASQSFQNLNYKVKLFDVSNKGGLENIHAFNRGYAAFEKDNIKSFKYNGFEIISKNSKLSLPKMLASDYEVAVFDFGSFHSTCNDFLKMQNKVFILPSQPYAIKENAKLLDELLMYQDIRFLVNLKNENYQDILDYLNIPQKRAFGVGFLSTNKINKEDQNTFLNLCQINKRPIQKQNFIKKLFA